MYKPFKLLKGKHSAQTLAAADSAAGDAVSDVESVQMMRSCLDTLSSLLRSVVSLKVLAGEDYADIATSLGRSKEAARKAVSRGLKELRECLIKRGMSPRDLP